MARVPIACDLAVDDAAARIDEWREFLGTRVVEVNRGKQSARLRLEDSDEAILTAVDLVRREKLCCPFFVFQLVPLAEAVWLEVEAPAEAGAILDALVNLTPT